MKSKMQLKSEDIDFEGFQLKAEIVEKMLKVSREAQSRSHSPYSKFQVGSAALFENDVIIPGYFRSVG
jgi:hypothetical protein